MCVAGGRCPLHLTLWLWTEKSSHGSCDHWRLRTCDAEGPEEYLEEYLETVAT
jgi:hypothetical protein